MERYNDNIHCRIASEHMKNQAEKTPAIPDVLHKDPLVAVQV